MAHWRKTPAAAALLLLLIVSATPALGSQRGGSPRIQLTLYMNDPDHKTVQPDNLTHRGFYTSYLIQLTSAVEITASLSFSPSPPPAGWEVYFIDETPGTGDQPIDQVTVPKAPSFALVQLRINVSITAKPVVDQIITVRANTDTLVTWTTVPLTQDLSVQPNAILIPNRVPAGLVPVNVTVYNSGTAFVPDGVVAVELFDNGRSAATAYLSTERGYLPADDPNDPNDFGQNRTVVTLNWTAVLGEHELVVHVDPGDEVTEANEVDNMAKLEVSVYDPAKPVAIATATPTTQIALQPIDFDGSQSYDPDHPAFDPWNPPIGDVYGLNYTWELGDGSVLYGVQVRHAYAVQGQYDAILRVRDQAGNEDEDVVRVTVENLPPIASLARCTDVAPIGAPVVLDGSGSIDADGQIVTYAWDFGDGETEETLVPLVEHMYAEAGEYTLTLNVSDNFGATNATSKVITVREVDPPRAVFTMAPNSEAEVGQTVEFDASNSYPEEEGAQIVNYTWDFDDGYYGYGRTTAHVFVEPGSFTVKLRVRDSFGSIGTAIRVLSVLASQPKAVLTCLSHPVVEGRVYLLTYERVQFDGGNSTPGTGATLTRYRFFRGDGTYADLSTPLYQTEYPQDGTYEVGLTVTDSNGASADAPFSIIVVVENRAPVAVPSASANETVVGAVVTFDGTGSYDEPRDRGGDGEVVRWLWEFGDGVTEEGAIVNHTYATAGNFTAALVVEDDDGFRSEVVRLIIFVRVDPNTLDTDLDGLPDAWELRYGLDPGLNDTDGDGTLDPLEDGDGDGFSNVRELNEGTDPTDRSSRPAEVGGGGPEPTGGDGGGEGEATSVIPGLKMWGPVDPAVVLVPLAALVLVAVAFLVLVARRKAAVAGPNGPSKGSDARWGGKGPKEGARGDGERAPSAAMDREGRGAADSQDASSDTGARR